MRNPLFEFLDEINDGYESVEMFCIARKISPQLMWSVIHLEEPVTPFIAAAIGKRIHMSPDRLIKEIEAYKEYVDAKKEAKPLARKYKPEIFEKPGETLRKLILERGDDKEKDSHLKYFAYESGMDYYDLLALLVGNLVITKKIAAKISKTTNTDAQLWLDREKSYQDYLEKKKFADNKLKEITQNILKERLAKKSNQNGA